MKLLYVVGARPNFMKVAPIMRAAAQRGVITQVLVHTGQHFDEQMSDVFFRELGLPAPDEHLHVAGGSHAEQTARIMLAIEPVLLHHRPDWLVVVGDVNSTVAAALVAAKLGIRIAHVEAGLRSGDMTMPEEVNRRVTDAISDILLIPSLDARENLLREGVPEERIHFVGNVMIDSLVRMLPLSESQECHRRLGLTPDGYVLATLHRPSNVDSKDSLQGLMSALIELGRETSVVFPVHPRTRQRLAELCLNLDGSDLRLIDPLGYLDFLALMRRARAVITDSGGVQEETTYLGVPCFTVRRNTERPVTISSGTNQLVEPSSAALLAAFAKLNGRSRGGTVPERWDGRAAERILESLLLNR